MLLFVILENSVLVHNENMIISTHYLPSSTVPAFLHNGLGSPTSVKSKDSPPQTYPQDNLIWAITPPKASSQVTLG